MIRKIYIFFLFLAFSSCYDDFDTSSDVIESEVAGTTIETGLTGVITNVGVEEIGSYELTKDGQTIALGQINFYRYLDKATKRGQLFELYNNNRLVGVTNPLLIENDINYIEVSPFQNVETYTYKFNNSLNIQISDDFELTIGKNAFLDNQSQLINTDILVDIAIDEGIANQLGNLAYNGDEAVLLSDAKAILMNGDTKNLKMNNVNTSIHFNNNNYNGQSLFFINQSGIISLIHENIKSGDIIPVQKLGVFVIANYESGVYIEGTMVKGNNKVSYMPFKNESLSYFSTSQGNWAGFFPINSNVSIDILTPCLDLLENQNLEVGDTEEVLELVLTEGDDLIYNVKTKVIDCEGGVEDVQAINVSYDDNSFIYVYNNEEIDTWLPICKSEFDIAGIDNSLQQRGPQFSWSIDINDQISVVSHCDSYGSGFGFVEINEEEHVYDSFEVESNSEITSLKSSEENLRLHFDGLTARLYNEQEVRIFIKDPSFGENGYSISCENSSLGCGIKSFNVTHFDDENEGWIRVSFSGVLWAQTINPPVAGNYPISGVILSKLN